MKPIHFAISVVLLLILVCASPAEDISVSASVDKKVVRVADVITLTIQIQGTQSASAPNLPDIDGFRSQYLGPSTQVSIVNGRSSVSVGHRYYLVASKTGRFAIPSIAVEYKGKTYQTDPIGVQVVSGPGSQQSKQMTQEDLKEYIYLTISTKRKTAYLNEGVPLLLRLHIRSGVDVRDIRYPNFPSAGFSMLDFNKPVQRQANIDGVRFTIVDFRTTVYPVTSGELALGPAELNCSLTVTSSQRSSRSRDPFFDRRTRYPLTVRSEPYTITVKPLPTAGRPKNFDGAVGQYSFDVVAKPTSLKVGEPITLTMTVKGYGNIDTVNIPKIVGLTQFKVYDPQISVNKTGNSGEKTFEQVLIPRSDDVKAVPEILFSYFDPEAEQYRTRTRGPIPIQVAPSDEAEPLQILEMAEGKAITREILGRDIVYIKDDMESRKLGDSHLYKNKGFLLLQLFPLVGFAGVLVYQRRRDRFATDRTYARQYHAPKKAKKGLVQARRRMASDQPQEFCSAVFKIVQEYLGDRFDLPFAGITIAIVDDLRSRGIPEGILEKLTDLFESYDKIRFAQSHVSGSEMSAILDLATESIELLENAKV